MTQSLTIDERTAVAALAKILLPGSNTQPSAAVIDSEAQAIDLALGSRPDLFESSCALLERFEGEAEHFLQDIPARDFDLLSTLICGAYLMDASVKKALGYMTGNRR